MINAIAGEETNILPSGSKSES